MQEEESQEFKEYEGKGVAGQKYIGERWRY